jgi:ClpP class serine protease
MSVGDIFWFFFMFTALQPVLRQRMLEAMRTRKIARLEKKRNSRVILLVHRQETMRFLGFPLARYIDINDSEEVLRANQMTDGEVPLDMWSFTLPAGWFWRRSRSRKPFATTNPRSPSSCRTTPCREARLLRSRPTKSSCASTPSSALSIRNSEIRRPRPCSRSSEQKPVAEIDDQTLIRADIGRKAIAQVKQAAAGLLQRTLPTDRAEALAEKLATGTWTHDYPIWATTAKELGLPVRTDMPNEVLDLMSLYPQPVRAQGGGGVEYLPAPRQREA